MQQQCFEKERVELELARVRDELVRKTQLAAIGQVSGSIAHDLRNPLGSVRNAQFLLKRRLPKDEPRITEPLRIIDEEVARADQIISNLLSIARRQAPERKICDLEILLRRVLDCHQEDEQIECRMLLSPTPFQLFGDENQLQQVFTNLYSNAYHAMSEGGLLQIEARRDPDADVIEFKDNGMGIPAEVRDKLFEPLVTTKVKGTGLGLTICQQIVEAHGGTISAHNQPEQGACIRIELPLAQTEDTSFKGDPLHGIGSNETGDREDIDC